MENMAVHLNAQTCVIDISAIFKPYFSKGRGRIVGGAVVALIYNRRATTFSSFFFLKPHAKRKCMHI